MRVGMGFDVHRLTTQRPLILGGITIPYKMGLLGHSDADVLIHAVCDALLGAAGLGDIGIHFPDTDPKFKDIDSLLLLKYVGEMLKKDGFSVLNIDATLLAEQPKIAPYRIEMQRNIARAINIDPSLAHVKATTTEGLGSIGRGEGIAAMCVALIT
jgi:2-C-methyl-D-erythritol 2,4-cyclodiphosphate synthase